MVGTDADAGVSNLFGTTAPGGTTDTDAAEIGSLYQETTTGALYQKRTAGSGTDKWERIARLSDVTAISFRSEKVIAATVQAAPVTGSVLNLTTTPLTGDDTPFLSSADFAVDDYILFGIGGTPKLMRVSVVAAPNITVVDAATALRDDDKFVVRHYLPDVSDGQEKQSLVVMSGGAILKLADFNWNLADGIALNGAIIDRQGPVVGTDSVQVAVEKLEGDSKDTAVLSGVARGATDLGTFAGVTIADNRKIKEALQDLESALENNGRASGLGITTLATVDSILVDNTKASKWLIYIRKNSTPADSKAFEVFAMHDGSSTADAANVDDTVYAKLSKGSNFNYTLSIDLSGTGGAQVMRLRVSSTEIGGVDVFAFRQDCK